MELLVHFRFMEKRMTKILQNSTDVPILTLLEENGAPRRSTLMARILTGIGAEIITK